MIIGIGNMNNPRKGKLYKNIWFKDEKEYHKLIEAIEHNDKELVFNMISKMKEIGDL